MTKAKRQHIPNAAEVFNGEYMMALNEKFKVRGQLAALMNELEEVRARNERLKYSLQEKDNPMSTRSQRPAAAKPQTPAPSIPAAVPQAPPDSPRKILTVPSTPLTPTPPRPPAQAIAIQTVQPEPPSLFAEDPIRGLPPVISPIPLIIPQAPSRRPPPPPVMAPPPPPPHPPSAPTSGPTSRILEPPQIKASPQSPRTPRSPRADDYLDEGIDIDLADDLQGLVVVVKRKPSVSSVTSNQSLEEELGRLRKRYEEITFYTIIIIFALFSIMLLKEMRMLMMHKPCATSAPSDAGLAARAKHPNDVELSLRLETGAAGVRSCGDCASTPPTTPPMPDTDTKIILKAAPPCDAQPIIEVKCGELAAVTAVPEMTPSPTQFDCDCCNEMIGNQTAANASCAEANT